MESYRLTSSDWSYPYKQYLENDSKLNSHFSKNFDSPLHKKILHKVVLYTYPLSLPPVSTSPSFSVVYIVNTGPECTCETIRESLVTDHM